MREKLIELLRNAKVAMKAENLSCDIARNMFVVDFMMANGVTIQEWIPVTERLPEEEGGQVMLARMYRGKRYVEIGEILSDGTVLSYSDDYKIHPKEHIVTHWMPLPTPPKGE